jgi:hypothetical protein
MTYYVYELVDPRNDSVFYVGKGSGDRAYRHERNVRHNNQRQKKSNPKLFNKISSIVHTGSSVVVRIVEHFNTEDEAYEKEAELVAQYGLSNLTNLVHGGRGGMSGEVHPFFGRKRPEHSAKLKGRQMSQDTKDRISEAWTAERKAQHSQSMAGDRNPFAGKKHSESTKARISKALSGRKLPETTRKKISDRMKGEGHPNWHRPMSAATREKLVASWTDERKANNSGECHPQAKLTRALAAQIREHRANGATYADLSERFGLSISTIWRAVTKTVWSEK